MMLVFFWQVGLLDQVVWNLAPPKHTNVFLFLHEKGTFTILVIRKIKEPHWFKSPY